MVEENKSAAGDGADGGDSQQEAQPVPARKPEVKAYCGQCPEKPYFSKPENWIHLGTLLAIGIYTGITALIWCTSNRQFGAVVESNRISNEAMIASNRAWIAPIGVELLKMVQEGQKIEYRLSYQNTGHSPAEQATFFGDQKGVTETPVEQYTLAPDRNSRGWIGNKTCDPALDQQRVHNWPSVYPFSQPTYTLDFESDEPASKEVVEGRVAKLTRGCFAYNTLSLKRRYSQYCFYLQPGEWKFHRCAYGNDAN